MYSQVATVRTQKVKKCLKCLLSYTLRDNRADQSFHRVLVQRQLSSYTNIISFAFFIVYNNPFLFYRHNATTRGLNRKSVLSFGFLSVRNRSEQDTGGKEHPAVFFWASDIKS